MGLGAMYDGLLWETDNPVALLCPMVVQRRTRNLLKKEVSMFRTCRRGLTAAQLIDLPDEYWTLTQFALGVIYMPTAGDHASLCRPH